MNLVIISGVIVKEIDFRFVYSNNQTKSYNIVKGISYLRDLGSNMIKIILYNNIAEYMYRNIRLNDVVVIEGKIENEKDNNVINVKYIYKI